MMYVVLVEYERRPGRWTVHKNNSINDLVYFGVIDEDQHKTDPVALFQSEEDADFFITACKFTGRTK